MSRVRRLLITYIGLAGGLFLAAGAWLGGARPHTDLRSNIFKALAKPESATGVVLWAVGLIALGYAWWQIRKLDLTVKSALWTAALWAAPLLIAPPLASRDIYAYACQGATLRGGLNPYEVGSNALPCPWLSSMSLGWQKTTAPYGPIWVLMAGLAIVIAGSSLWTALLALRIAAVFGVVLMAWAIPALARAAGTDPTRAIWLGLASPLLVIHLVSGGHNDAVMIGLALAGLVAAQKRRGLLAGGLLGAAIAVKATAGIALPFAVLMLMRERSVREFLTRTAAALAGTLVAFGVITLASGLGFGWLRGLASSGDSVQWTAPPTALGMAVGALSKALGHDVTTGAIEVCRLLGWVALAVSLVWIWLRALKHGNPLRYLAYALLAVLAFSPVFHPWYALWPMAVIAVTMPDWTPARVAAVGLPFLTVPDGDNLALRTKLVGAVAMSGLVIAAAVYGLRRLGTSLRKARQP
ncbi:hypothetical protein Afil01_05340 [Actinorhabdospora filicis]|uniref:Alpha-1,6-mannosyltransferase n=1 Tax=Actinorhabdospora filicis TaxID=1785913 RepID=A0A9W6W1C0_9ACTN|nr:polyprenol phosphomannose-dependent alpha 1,6 mannosyltransferase MptB [Actinorhabdospora filicis]GLZ75727.1 hypothetical protein Afil01_05340 [Actinorhabdospora filicis]